MMSKECIAPGRVNRRCAKQSEVVGMSIENFLAIDKITQEAVRKTAA